MPDSCTVEPQLSGLRLSGLFDYPDFFSGPVFLMNINKLINIHVFDYPDSRLSGLFTEVPTSPDNRGSTVLFLDVTTKSDSENGRALHRIPFFNDRCPEKN